MAINLDDAFQGNLVSSHQQGMALTAMADRNLTQGLGVVNTAIVEANSIPANAADIAALQTASRAPAQGANEVSVPK